MWQCCTATGAFCGELQRIAFSNIQSSFATPIDSLWCGLRTDEKVHTPWWSTSMIVVWGNLTKLKSLRLSEFTVVAVNHSVLRNFGKHCLDKTGSTLQPKLFQRSIHGHLATLRWQLAHEWPLFCLSQSLTLASLCTKDQHSTYNEIGKYT